MIQELKLLKLYPLPFTAVHINDGACNTQILMKTQSKKKKKLFNRHLNIKFLEFKKYFIYIYILYSGFLVIRGGGYITLLFISGKTEMGRRKNYQNFKEVKVRKPHSGTT